MKMTKLITALTALVLTLPTWADTDENGLTPLLWFKFNQNATSVGSNTNSIDITDGTYVDLGDGNYAWQMGTTGYQTSYNSDGKVYPGTYVCRINLNGQTYDSNKCVWGANGQAYNGPSIVVDGKPGAYQIKYNKHGSSYQKDYVIAYDVPTDAENEWYWCIIVIDAQYSSSFYVNGELVGTATFQTCSGQNAFFSLGKFGNGNDAAATGCQIDDLRKYSQALTTAQVMTICGVTEIEAEDDVTTEWINEQGDGAKKILLTLPAGAKLTFTEELECTSLILNSTGSITLAGEQPNASELAKLNTGSVQGTLMREWIGSVISIGVNFFSNRGSDVSGALIPNSVWCNSTGGTNNTRSYGTYSEFFSDELTKVAWDCNNVYQVSLNNTFIDGYLDDGGSHAQVTVSGIPWTTYDVLVYCATDTTNKKFQPVTVNNTQYTDGGDGIATEGSATWGASRNATPVMGTNVIRINGLSASSLNIVGGGNSNGARGGIAAIQIVKHVSERTIEMANEINVSVINDMIDADDSVTLTLTTTEDKAAKLIFDAEPIFSLLKIVREGALNVEASNYAVTLDDFNLLNVEGVTGKITWNIPVSVINTADTQPAYQGGAGAEGQYVVINHNGGSVTLAGLSSTFYLSESCNDTETTVNFDNANVIYGDNIGVGTAVYNITRGSKVSASRIALSQGAAGRTAVLNLVDSELKITGEKIFDSNQNSAMFGHWNGPSTFTMSGDSALFRADNTTVLVGKTSNTQTINLDGGNFAALGIMVSAGATGTNTLYLGGANLRLSTYGIDSYGSTTIQVNVTNDTMITATAETMTISQPINIAAGKTLTIEADSEAVVKITGAVTGEGKLVLGENVKLSLGQVRQNPIEVELYLSESEVRFEPNIIDDGVIPKMEFTLAEGSAEPELRVYDFDGNDLTHDDGTYTIYVSGKACWLDWEFENGSLQSEGTDTRSLTLDHSYGLPADKSAFNSESNALFTASDAWMSITYPTEWSASIYTQLPPVENAVLMAFGTMSDGAIALITGDTNKNEVVLARTTGNSKYSVLATMTVPNATIASHLYSFCKSDKEIKIYLDSNLWTSYSSDTSITFGGGFQIGSLHGGIGSTGFIQYGKTYFDDENEANNSTISALRIFDSVLGPNAIKALAEEFPYISPNGSYSRTIGEGEETTTFSKEGGWYMVTDDGEESWVDAPAEGAVAIETGVSTEITADISVTMESLSLFGEEQQITFKQGEGKLVNAGLTTIYENLQVTIEGDALDIGGGVLELLEGAKLTFDYTDYDVSEIYATTVIQLTGLVDEQEEGVITIKEPTNLYGRTVTSGYDLNLQRYVMTISPSHEAGSHIYWKEGVFGSAENPAVFTNALGEVIEIYPGDRFEIAGSGDFETLVSTNMFRQAEWATDGYLAKIGEGELVMNLSSAFTGNFKVKEGVAKLGGAHGFGNASVSGDAANTNSALRITVEADATADMNGVGDYVYGFLLNGGTFANTTSNIYNGARQACYIGLTADSYINAAKNFGLINGGFAATRIDLDGHKLTMNGEASFWLCKTTISGPGTFYVQSGTLYSCQKDCEGGEEYTLTIGTNGNIKTETNLTAGNITFEDGASLEPASGTLTAANAITFGNTLKVKLSVLPDENGTKLNLVASTYPETLPAVTLVIGDETLSGYALEAKEDGLYVVSATVEGLLFYLK